MYALILQGGSVPNEYRDVLLMRELHLTPKDLGIEEVTVGDLNRWFAALLGERRGNAEASRRAASPMGG